MQPNTDQRYYLQSASLVDGSRAIQVVTKQHLLIINLHYIMGWEVIYGAVCPDLNVNITLRKGNQA